jgi:hypothetical protein
MKWMKGLFVLLTLAAALNGHAELSGQVESGLTYDIRQNQADTTTIELTVDVGFASENEIQQGLNLLLAFALLQETELLSRTDIQSLLHDCREDISPQAHIEVGPRTTKFIFHVPDDKKELLYPMLSFIEQISRHATLSSNAVELAKNDVVEMLASHTANDIQDQILTFLKLLFSFTRNQVLDYYRDYYSPAGMSLTVRGSLSEKEIEKAVLQIFGPLSERTVISENIKPVRQTIRTSGSTVYIDGKIAMNKPSWQQTRWWGTLVAIACGVIAAGCFYAGIFFPPLIALGFIPIAGAVYFSTDPYLSDPIVVEQKRLEDLQKGFRHSYMKNRADRTLTPFERRNFFIQENSCLADPYPDMFHEFVISDLADVYRLNDKVFSAMLYLEEYRSLSDLKREFILQRNDVKSAKKALDEELNMFLASHQMLRDQKLDIARETYESHPAVALMRQITEEWADVLAEIWQDFENKLITKEQLENLIEDANAFYESLLADPELLVGVQEAKELLDYKQRVILSEYEQAVILVKTTINYDQRVAIIEAGKWTLYAHFNNELIRYIFTMTYDDPNFPDALDLRNIEPAGQ